MNIYTGSNDVSYWLYNSQQNSIGKTGIYWKKCILRKIEATYITTWDNCATWLVKNGNMHFGKLMQKIFLLASGRQVMSK